MKSMKIELFARKQFLLHLRGRMVSPLFQRAIDRQLQIIDDIFVSLHKKERIPMEKLKLALSTDLVNLEDITMRPDSAELEAKIKELSEKVPVNKGIPVNTSVATYQALNNRLTRMRNAGRIARDFHLYKRGENVYLGNRPTQPKKALTKSA
jgi:hypothetical protein